MLQNEIHKLPGKVDSSRKGQVFTRGKETAASALRIWRCELLWFWQFSSELEGRAFVQDEKAVGEKWLAITNWFDKEPSPDNHLPTHISGETQKKSSCKAFFFFSFRRKIPLSWSYTSIWESLFCDSPFSLTFDKCSAISLHFLKKVAHILTFRP